MIKRVTTNSAPATVPPARKNSRNTGRPHGRAAGVKACSDRPALAQEFLTESQLAEVTGLTVAYLRDNRRKARDLPFIKLGHRLVRYELTAVRTALAALTVGGPQAQAQAHK